MNTLTCLSTAENRPGTVGGPARPGNSTTKLERAARLSGANVTGGQIRLICAWHGANA